MRFTKELISEGSFGIVEKCFINSKLFAVKKLKPRIEKATLNKEIDFLNNLYLLTHKPKCFPKYYGCVIEMSSLLSEPTGYNLFFEYCEFDLRKKLNKSADKSLSFEMIKQYFHDLIRGFAFLQSKGWSHGDLKPDNFLIDAKNQIKIIDFGTIQKFNEAEKEKKYEFIGTDPYKSPEFVIADLNSEKKIYVNLFKSDVFSLGIIGLEMGGTYDSQNYEKTQTLNDFQAKITQCINAFENKFISEIEKNEDNKSFFLLLKSSLHMNSDIRGDFISLFSKILSVKDKIKLKYHVFVEDHDNFLYTKSQKNEKYLKEQNRIEIKKKCCQNCLKKVCSFLCETCIQGFINSIKKCVKSLCYRLFRCCQILCQGVKYIAELIKACCSGLGQGCQKYIELLKNDGEASFFFFMYTLFQIFCIVSFAIRVNFLVTDDFNKDLYFEMLPILSEAFLASIIIDVFLIIYLFIYIYGVIFGKKSSLLNFLFVAIKCIKIIVIIVIWVSDQAYPCPDEDWRNCNPEESEKLAQILRIRGIKTYDSLTICENLEKASLFICLYMVVLILCQE